MSSDLHSSFMRRALELAEKGRGWTYPNPLVGAVLVRNGKILAEGYHKCFGEPHAEVEALLAGRRTEGADLYVTLEPCRTFGKTPPCTRLIAEKKIRQVILAAVDPNPAHAGSGKRELKKNGIRVVTGILKREAEKQNEAFFKWMRTGLPFVTLKMAQTLDGKIATEEGESRWITSQGSRNYVHQLRGWHQAVLVGKRTVLLDDPRLNVNAQDLPQPVRIVLDKNLELPLSRKVFKNEDRKIIVAASEAAYRKKYPVYARKSIGLLAVKSSRGVLELADLLVQLAKMGIISILVEGGGETAAQFLAQKCVDKVCFFVAPKILGGRKAITSVEGAGVKKLSEALLVREMKVRSLGEDFLFEGYLN